MSDNAWDSLADLCEAGFSSSPFQKELIDLCGNQEDIAWVVYYHNRDNSLKWMKSKVSALKGKTPGSCFPANIGTLKQVLLAFPC